jgi:hypothetical protein
MNKVIVCSFDEGNTYNNTGRKLANLAVKLVNNGGRTGIAGSQIYKGVLYPGGGNQVQIMNYVNRGKLVPLGDPYTISYEVTK